MESSTAAIDVWKYSCYLLHLDDVPLLSGDIGPRPKKRRAGMFRLSIHLATCIASSQSKDILETTCIREK